MTDAAGDRPQDVGRSHAKRGQPSLDTLAVLERYRAEMRAEMTRLLDELARPADGIWHDAPTLDRRRDVWGLAVKLARELAAEQSGAGDPPAGSSQRARPAPALTVAARRKLGQ